MKVRLPKIFILSISIMAVISFFAFSTREAHSITIGGLADGGTITVGDKIFENWEVSAPSYALDNEVIEQTWFTALEGINFDDEIASVGTTQIEYDIRSLDPTYFISSFSYIYLASTDEYSTFEVTQTITDPDGAPLLDFYDTISGGGLEAPGASGTFDPQSSVHVTTSIVGTTTTTQPFQFALGDLVHAVGQMQVAPVPEPSTILLLGTGLVGLVGLRRKFRN